MSLYVDSSALCKRYVDEPESEACGRLLASEDVLLTARHAVVEVRRALARLLEARDAARQREALVADLRTFAIIELDAVTCEAAAVIAETLGTSSLDALHLAAAQRAGGSGLSFLTYDIRQARAARALGLAVVGV